MMINGIVDVHTCVKQITDEQVFYDKCPSQVLLALVYSTLQTSKFSDEQVLQFIKFFYDKLLCSKTSMLVFEQVHLTRKILTSFNLHTSKSDLSRSNLL